MTTTAAAQPQETSHDHDDEEREQQPETDQRRRRRIPEGLPPQLAEMIGDIRAQLGSDDDQDDPVPGSLHARLFVLTPQHAYWQKSNAIEALPPELRALVQGRANVHIVGLTEKDLEQRQVMWSTRSGLWTVVFMRCIGHHTPGEDESDTDRFHLKVKGPDVDLELNDMKADDVIELLTLIGALKP